MMAIHRQSLPQQTLATELVPPSQTVRSIFSLGTRQLRLVGGAPPVFCFRRRVFLAPFFHGPAIEQVFDDPRIEYAESDSSRSALKPDGSGSGAWKTPVLQPALPFLGGYSQDVLDLARDDRKVSYALQ